MSSSAYKSWYEEAQSAWLYAELAAVETHPNIREMFDLLRKAAVEQGALWLEKMKAAGEASPAIFVPTFRARVVAMLIRTLGPKKIRMILAAMKVRGLSVYSSPASLRGGHLMPTKVEDIGLRHKSAGEASNLRAAVFGVNDGLVSTASLVLGMKGAGLDSHTILLAGLAGVVAGAFSMASGEYVSVKSQREMFEYQIGLEREELEEYPDEEAEELVLIYKARGLDSESAHKLAREMISDKERGLDALAREELGLNPGELVSPWGAAIFSFLSFATGGTIPLIPFLAGNGEKALVYTIALVLLALFIVGNVLSLFTGRNALLSGLRMMVIGALAGALTYALGTLF